MPNENIPTSLVQVHKSQKILIVILLFVILILSLTLGYLIKNPYFAQRFNKSNTGLDFPANPKAASVASIGLSYEYRGKVSKIKNDNRGLILITDITAEGAPEFIIDNATKSYILSRGVEVSANSSLIKPGDKVALFERYDLNLKNWKLNKVDILKESSSSPSAYPNFPKIIKNPVSSPKP